MRKIHFGKKLLFHLLYFSALLYISIYSFKKPAYNWDMLPYMGVIVSYEHKDISYIHNVVYSTVRKEVPGSFYNQLTDSTNAYRNKVANDPIEFNLQLPFYIVKPLYTRLCYLFYKLGLSLTASTVAPSIIAYFLIGCLLLYWFKKYLPLPLAFAVSLILLLWAPLLAIATLSTPDCLSTFLLLMGFYFIIEKRSMSGSIIFFLLAIFARLDNTIDCLLLLSALVFFCRHQLGITVKKYIWILLSIVSCYLLVSFLSVSYGWDLLYFPSFYSHLNTSHNIHTSFSIAGYIALIKSQLMTGICFSQLPLFLFLFVVLFFSRPFYWRGLSIEQIFLFVFIGVILIKFVLHPAVADRFYVSYYLCTLIFIVKKIGKTKIEVN